MIEPGSKVGTIRVVELIAEGGMGAVYVGFDEKLQREVALKALRGDLLDEKTRTRLLYEARVLSQLEHPNICRVYDFIDDEIGSFIVLERVPGRTLREVLANDDLSRSERFRIAVAIAGALEAAHRKGIVHRDLKLDNVMRTPSGEVKVLDFGLARTAGEDPPLAPDPVRGSEPLQDEAASRPSSWVPSTYEKTAYGQVVGTVTAMSPEQARGEAVTAASDVYSLGLLLQELLTGHAPYERGLPRHLALVKAAEGDIHPIESGPVDLKNLLERLLAIAPEARPSAAWTAERLAWIKAGPRRLKQRIAIAAIGLITLFFGIKYAVDLDRERRLALEARDEAEQVTEFLVEIFEVSDPGTARGEAITAREVLDRGAEMLGRDLEGRPALRTRLLETIGIVYQKLGLYDQASPLLEDGLNASLERFGDGSLEVARSRHRLGVVEISRGNHERAEDLLQSALAVREERLGPDDVLVAETLTALGSNFGLQGLFAEAEPFVRRGLTIREKALPPDALEIADSASMLAAFLGSTGRADEAREMYRRARSIQAKTLPDDHPDVVRSLVGQAITSHQLDDLDDAETAFRQVVDIQERVLGPDHADLALTLYNLALVRRDRGDLEDAETLMRRVLAIREPIYPEHHPRLSSVVGVLGRIQLARGEAEQGIELLTRFLEDQRAFYGEEARPTIHAWSGLGVAQYGLKNYVEAERLFDRARQLAGQRAEADPEVRERLLWVNLTLGLGEVRRAAGRPVEALKTWRSARETAAQLAEEAGTAAAQGAYATLLLYLDDVEAARPWVEQAFAKGWRQRDFLDLSQKHGLLPNPIEEPVG